MKYYISFSFLLICISLNAQNNVPANSVIDTVFSPKLTGESFFENKQYIGEQYFNKDWEKGDVLLSTGEMVYNKRLKYNGLFDEVIWMNNSNFGKYQLDKSSVSDFWLNSTTDKTIHFKHINIGDSTGGHGTDIFAQVGVEGKVSLYIQRKISITGEANVYINNSLFYFNNIGESPLYFIKLTTNHFTKLSRISRRVLLKLFPEKKKEIVKLMSDNHLNLKNESDLIKLIGLLNKEVFLEK